MPSAQELIRRTEAACAEQEEEEEGSSALALTSLAEAKAYSGDFVGALRTAQLVKGLMRSSAVINSWVIHLEQTGNIAKRFDPL